MTIDTLRFWTIRSSRHRGPKRLFLRGDRSVIRPDLIDRVEVILALLDVARSPQAMRLPGYRLHALKGDGKGTLGSMPMKNPPHPGKVVRVSCLEPLGLSVTDGARVLGVSRQALSNLVNGHARVSTGMAIRLAKAFGSTTETWIRLQAAYDVAQAQALEDDIQVDRYRPSAVV